MNLSNKQIQAIAKDLFPKIRETQKAQLDSIKETHNKEVGKYVKEIFKNNSNIYKVCIRKSSIEFKGYQEYLKANSYHQGIEIQSHEDHEEELSKHITNATIREVFLNTFGVEKISNTK